MAYQRRNISINVARMRGITLIELMIVVVVIGILTAVAYPSYRDQVMRTHRTDGKATLMQVSQELERCYTRFAAYNNAGCAVAFPVDSPEGHYTVTATALTASAFTLDATPQGGQADDDECGVLRLTSTGIEGSQGESADDNDCW